MKLLVLGLNHETAPIAVREKMAFPAQDLADALGDLLGAGVASEAVIVSTCNRTELYCNSETPDAACDWLADFHQFPRAQLRPYLYQLEAEAAARHAYRVACGLDSMVLGETQILGQLKDAVRVAQSADALGTLLNYVFQNAFAVAKTVRSQTAIGANSISMAAAAVRLAEQIFPSIEELNVLFVGAGEMIELVATHYAAHHPAKMSITNRTLARAQDLASRFPADSFALDELGARLHQYDVVITSTGSPNTLIDKNMMDKALKMRRFRPVFMLDLAVPRDIAAEVGELDDVFLYTVDDLASVVEAGKDARRLAALEAEGLIARAIVEFQDWQSLRDIVPVIRALRDEGEKIRLQALKVAEKQLARGEDPQKIIENLSQQLSNKFLHAPSQALHKAPPEQRAALRQSICRLYGLQGDHL